MRPEAVAAVIVGVLAVAAAEASAHRRQIAPPPVAVVAAEAGRAGGVVEGEDGRRVPRVEMRRVDAAPVIDGKMDGDAWTSGAIITEFTQVIPVEGAAPSERTEVRLLYDDDFLYIGVRAFDSAPGEIVATQMLRDGDLGADDRVAIALDTFADRRNGYLFEVGAAGGKRDGLIENNRTIRYDWDGVWIARTGIDGEGWTAEIAIPFKTLTFSERGDRWGLNIERVVRRRNETVRWASPTRNSAIRVVADAGVARGFEGLRQGLGLTVTPFLSARTDLERGSVRFEPGVDVFYRITPAITAAVTVNTDFAEAEVDQRRVNLTRFPLFFPEKREFFLQDSHFFHFGGVFRSPLPFFSRRIGIVRGEEKDILAGVKLTGRHDKVQFGLLNVQMDHDEELGSKNLTVGRASVDVLDESSVGVVFTHGDPATRGENSLAGLDFNYRDSNFIGDNALEAHAWIQGTHSSGESGPTGENDDPVTFGGRISYPNDKFSFSLFAAQIGEDYHPALGFVERTGVREYNGDIRWRWRPNTFVRRIDVGAGLNVFTDLDDEVETADFTIPEVEIETRPGDVFTVGLGALRDNFDEDFQIHPDVVVPGGDYKFNRASFEAQTSTARPVSARLFYGAGDFLSGDRQDYLGALEWRPSRYFFGAIEHEVNDVNLPEGDFTVRIARLRADVLFSPAVSWSNIVQYDNVSEQVGLNSRLRWEIQPGRVMFVVINQGFDADRSFETFSSELTVKVGWSLWF